MASVSSRAIIEHRSRAVEEMRRSRSPAGRAIDRIVDSVVVRRESSVVGTYQDESFGVEIYQDEIFDPNPPEPEKPTELWTGARKLDLD